MTTVWMFAAQILHGNTACTHAVRLLRGLHVTDSAYCQARRRLPLKVLKNLMTRVARQFHERYGDMDLWHGHRVLMADGSSCSMPDAPALQEHFGQPKGQTPGCGFPVAHVLALFSASTGMLVDLLVNPMYTHDLSVVRQLHRHLRRGDVFVGDRAFCSFVHLALLDRRGAHAVMRMHQCRQTDFRRGRCLSLLDHEVTWTKPKQKPTWIDQATFDRIPKILTVREVRYRVETPGFRTKELILVTTLLDPTAYPTADLAKLYNRRWEVETNLRHLKQTLKMDVLRCKTVEGVTKELLMFLVIYNLVRAVMIEAGEYQGVPPDRISFIDVLRWLAQRHPGDLLPRFVVVPHRPGRVQPRRIKRRPKIYGLLNRPRDELRKALLR